MLAFPHPTKVKTHRCNCENCGSIAVSGSKDSRPELNKLVADAHRRKLDAVLVWKLDRFGRSLKHLVNSLAEFESLGVAFISLKESLDLTTPAGRLMFGIISAMAEFERDLIRERVRAGISNRRAKGFRVGRKPIILDALKLAALRSEGLTIRHSFAVDCRRLDTHRAQTAQPVSREA